MSDRTADTSVLVPALVAWHPNHDECRELLRANVAQLPAHVLLETYSVLTRLPAPHRITPTDAATLIDALPFRAVVLPAEPHRRLVRSFIGSNIRGGAVYDTLIAATAAHHKLHLLTRDRRARSTYDFVGVGYTLG